MHRHTSCPKPATEEYLNDDVQPRPFYSCSYPKIMCDMREFSLTLDAAAVDTTAVGEKFGENVKSLVRGGGTFEFFIDRSCLGDQQENASWDILNMLFLTEGGGSQQPIAAEAWFYLMIGNGCTELLPTCCRGSLLPRQHPDYSNRSECPTD